MFILPIVKLGSFGLDFRIACCVSRIALEDWVCLGLFFGGGAGRDIAVNLCGIRCCGSFVVWRIGFVLHN